MKLWQVAAVTVAAAAMMGYAAPQERLDGIVAVVGDEIILKSELDAYIQMRISGQGLDPDSVDLQKVSPSILQELVDNKVLLVQAKEDSTISVKSEEVENALNNHIAMILNQNNLTMEQLEKELQERQGTTLHRFKSEARRAIKEQLYKQKLQQTYYFSTKVNRKDVEQFFSEYGDSLPQVGESVNLSKLSFKLSASDAIKQAAFEKIKSIKQQLDNGASFEEMAKKYSQSPEGAEGGDLGYLSKGSTTELAFEERAFGLTPGQISEPFETRLGYHIIQVIEKRDQKVKIRQIFINVAPDAKQLETVKARLDSLRQSIKTSQEFESTAKKLSADNVTKNRGGNLGWVSLLDISSSVRDAVKDLEPGQISIPVQEDDMISLYRLNERVENRKLSLENDYPIIAEKAKEIIAQKKLIEAISKWREKTFIDIRI